MKIRSNTSNIIFCILMMSMFCACSSKKAKVVVEPFSLTKQRIICDGTERCGKYIDSLIYTKINSQPNFNSLPFGLKIGISKEEVIGIIEKLNIKRIPVNDNSKIILESKIIDRYNYYETFPVKSVLTFNQGKLIEIHQELFINQKFTTDEMQEITEVYSGDVKYNSYHKTKTSRLEYYKFRIGILSTAFLEIFTKKYGDENYIILLESMRPSVRYSDVKLSTDILGYLWYKDGVLIDYDDLLDNADKIYNRLEIENNFNLSDIPFASITYSGIRRHFEERERLFNLLLNSSDSTGIEYRNEIMNDSLANVQSGGL